MTEENKDIIDFAEVFRTLREKRKTFFVVLPIVFVLSCIWIFPQPRYYTCEVKLAPEGINEDAGGLASMASSFGFNIGSGANSDAIYPSLYPELFESNDFIVSLLNIRVSTKDERVNCDYYTYLRDYHKGNPFMKPIEYLFNDEEPESINVKSIDAFNLDQTTERIIDIVKKNILCSVDRKTDVITITVTDQDRMVCALLADSIKERLQDFIIDYRTKKVRQDVAYYEHLTDSAKHEYEESLYAYASYIDNHRNLSLQTYREYGEKLRNTRDVNLNAYNTLNAKLSVVKAKVQERTPSFTTLKSASIPLNPVGPKRGLFVFTIMLLTFAILLIVVLRKDIMKFIYIQNN